MAILVPFDTTLAFRRPEMMADDVKGTPNKYLFNNAKGWENDTVAILQWHLRCCELASLSMARNGSSGDGNFNALAWGLPGYPGFPEILDVEV